jgi:hypothetical protein
MLFKGIAMRNFIGLLMLFFILPLSATVPHLYCTANNNGEKVEFGSNPHNTNVLDGGLVLNYLGKGDDYFDYDRGRLNETSYVYIVGQRENVSSNCSFDGDFSYLSETYQQEILIKGFLKMQSVFNCTYEVEVRGDTLCKE